MSGTDFNRLGRADKLLAGGAIVLLLSMFLLKWYGGSISGPGPDGNQRTISSNLDGWHAFTGGRWLWLLTALLALGYVWTVAAQRPVGPQGLASTVVTVLGGLTVLWFLYRIIHHTHGTIVNGPVTVDFGLKYGIWIALPAALVLTAGAGMAMRRDGVSWESAMAQVSPAGGPAAPTPAAAVPDAPPAPPARERTGEPGDPAEWGDADEWGYPPTRERKE
jgi:hypothetical protein